MALSLAESCLAHYYYCRMHLKTCAHVVSLACCTTSICCLGVLPPVYSELRRGADRAAAGAPKRGGRPRVRSRVERGAARPRGSGINKISHLPGPVLVCVCVCVMWCASLSCVLYVIFLVLNPPFVLLLGAQLFGVVVSCGEVIVYGSGNVLYDFMRF